MGVLKIICPQCTEVLVMAYMCMSKHKGTMLLVSVSEMPCFEICVKITEIGIFGDYCESTLLYHSLFTPPSLLAPFACNNNLNEVGEKGPSCV